MGATKQSITSIYENNSTTATTGIPLNLTDEDWYAPPEGYVSPIDTFLLSCISWVKRIIKRFHDNQVKTSTKNAI